MDHLFHLRTRCLRPLGDISQPPENEVRLGFNPARHEYTADGRVLPSVTGIQRACGLSGSYEFRDRIHAFRGTSVHEGSSIIIAGGEPVLHTLRPPYDGYEDYVRVHADIPMYWEACRKAKAAIKFTGAIYECRMVDPVRGYAGTFDFCAWTDTDQIWDIKSGLFPVFTVIQICGYEDLIRRGIPIDPNHAGLAWLQDIVRSGRPLERCGLRLEKTGRFTAYYETTKGESFNLPKWQHAWRSALFLYTTIPDHEYTEIDDAGHPHKKSRLSDLKWVAECARERLKGAQLDIALRAGENLWTLRSQYGMI